jgi:hypothetical protein
MKIIDKTVDNNQVSEEIDLIDGINSDKGEDNAVN